MSEVRVYNVIDNVVLSSMTFDNFPEEGEPLEINREMYYVCERESDQNGVIESIGVIPLVVKNPKKVENIESYIHCLSIAHRRVRFRKGREACEFDDCDEMIVS